MVGTHHTFVIIGGGLAGAKAAEALRAEGFTGRVILIGDEREHPYQRPALSKDFLTGAEDRHGLQVHPPAWYARTDVELHLGQCAVALDRATRTLRLGDGTRIRYDALLLATGAEPRRLEIPGTDLAGVHHLRRLAHAQRLRGMLQALGRERGRLVIAGAGWIGLEVAAVARARGAEVTVVEERPTPLHGVLGPELGTRLADLHRGQGVRFHCGARLTEIVGRDGMVAAVRTDDGHEHPAQQVLAAVGTAPRTALAESAGLELAAGPHGGIAVDATLRTTDPDIYAAGDVAAVRHPLLGARLRGAHWANALHGGPAAARAMLGRAVCYDRLPYCSSQQYGLRLEYVGHAPPGGYDQVVYRGEASHGELVAFWLRNGRVRAGLSLSVADTPGGALPGGFAGSPPKPAEGPASTGGSVVRATRRLIRSGRRIATAPLADPTVRLQTLAEAVTAPG